jgi:hypothetical protein
LRTELHPQGVEVVTVSLELSGPEASRPFIEAARPGHPSLLDPTHALDRLFGVVNIPSVTWIDESGLIVRPPEPGWPTALSTLPARISARPEASSERTATASDDERRRQRQRVTELIASGQDRATYANAIRDWAVKGPDSAYCLSPEEVVARSQPRPLTGSEAAAHFELADYLWRIGQRAAAIRHFNAAHRLQPENWTYKRQAWSLVGNESVGGEYGRFTQGPRPGEEADWPFDSDFMTDVAKLEPGQYFPKTIEPA